MVDRYWDYMADLGDLPLYNHTDREDACDVDVLQLSAIGYTSGAL